MLRSLAKTGMACALHWTGSDRLIGALAGSKKTPLVIGYHRVVEDFAASAGSSIPAMLISRKMLERHIDWIGRRFRFVSLDELGSRLERGEAFNRPAVAITFDDGYGELYHNVFPFLKRQGIPAAVFVVTDLIGTSRLQIYDRLYLSFKRAFSRWRAVPRDLTDLLSGQGLLWPGMKRMGQATWTPFSAMRLLIETQPQAEIIRVVEALETEYGIIETDQGGLGSLSWEMIEEMRRAGITIGSHTKSHAVLPNEGGQKMLEETAGSRRELERRIGITVRHFAYPDGQFNAAAVRAAAAAGYRFGYTSCLHRDPDYPSLTIPRHIFWENSSLDALGRFSPAVMSCQVNRVFDAVAGCRQDHHI